MLEVLKEKEIEQDMDYDQNITEDIRDSYVIEYYRTDQVGYKDSLICF
jgi:hypothetical protein